MCSSQWHNKILRARARTSTPYTHMYLYSVITLFKHQSSTQYCSLSKTVLVYFESAFALWNSLYLLVKGDFLRVSAFALIRFYRRRSEVFSYVILKIHQSTWLTIQPTYNNNVSIILEKKMETILTREYNK